jgi:hypothetical protein
MKTLQNLKALRNQDLLLLCGEMTAGELRTLNAFKSWVVRELEREKSGEKNKSSLLKSLEEIESQILSEISRRCPPDSMPDAQAIPLLNRLEETETKTLDALDTLKNSVEELL